MKTIDLKFSESDLNLVRKLKGKEFNLIKCDPFYFSTSVYGIVGIKCGSSWLAFTNFVEVLDYYGGDEDVGRFKVSAVAEEDVHSYVNEKMITIPVKSKVTGIDVVNENQRLYENSELIYDVWITRGVIFHLENGREISFEKDVWLSEDIIVERGENLIEKFASTKDFSENWEGKYKGEAKRSTLNL